MASIPPAFVRWLHPLKGGLWLLFLLWTAGIAVIWTGNIGDSRLERAIGNTDLRLTLEWLIHIGDIVWITLAAINIHASVAESEGLHTARRWAFIVCGGGIAVAAASVLTGYPLGPIRYGAALGLKLGPVPWGVPLLWFVLVIGARAATLRVSPKAGNAWVAVAVGALVSLTDFNLEPVVAKLRGYWFWLASPPSLPPVFDPPLMNYGGWFVFGTLFAWFLREARPLPGPPPAPLPGGSEGRGTPDSRRRSWKPVIVFTLFNAVFLLARLGRIWRG
jgi:uncharacterized membrane protein